MKMECGNKEGFLSSALSKCLHFTW